MTTAVNGFVCAACGSGDHAGCRGGTWCDCQHRPAVQR